MMNFEIVLVVSALLIALNSALLGTFLVVNKMSMLIDAIAHAILPSIVASFILFSSQNSTWALVLSSLLGWLSVILMYLFSLNKNIRNDGVLGVTYTSLFAFGVILLSLNLKNSPFDLESILFGEINYLPFSKGIRVVGFKIPYLTLFLILFTLINFLIYFKFKKVWLLLTFDALYAKTLGVNVVGWNILFLSLISVNTVVNFHSVGAIMVISLTVIPAVFALVFTKKLNLFVVFSIVFALVSVLFGYGLAWFFNLNIVASISVIMGLVLFVSLIFRRFFIKT